MTNTANASQKQEKPYVEVLWPKNFSERTRANVHLTPTFKSIEAAPTWQVVVAGPEGIGSEVLPRDLAELLAWDTTSVIILVAELYLPDDELLSRHLHMAYALVADEARRLLVHTTADGAKWWIAFIRHHNDRAGIGLIPQSGEGYAVRTANPEAAE